MRFIHPILFLMCCFTAVAYGTESNQTDSEITNPETCDQCPKCPRDKHPAGEDCPHQPS